MSARERFVEFVKAQMGIPVLWGQKGPGAYDCSGLVTRAILEAGGPDLTKTHNADRLANETRPLLETEKPIAGDLVFFDRDQNDIEEHVAVYVAEDEIIDAEGATPRIMTLAEAVKRNARVRTHGVLRYRSGFKGVHRNTYVDSIDFVTM